MKTQLILGGLLAFATISNAQWSSSGATVYKTNSSGNVGIGFPFPSYKLEVRTKGVNDGMSIVQDSTTGATLYLNNTTTNGKKWSIFSSGSGNTQGAGHFFILDYSPGSGVIPFFIHGGTFNVGMGTLSPSAKLHAVGTSLAIKGDAGSSVNNTGVQGNGYYGVDGNGGLVGVRGNCQTSGGALNQGVRGNAVFGTQNVAGYFQSGGGASGVVSYGVWAETANTALGGTNYGIYATAGGNNTGGAGPNYAGYFNGDVVTAGGSFYYSDKRLKKDVVTIGNSLNIIGKLNPVNYTFDTEANPYLALPSVKQYGFLSQEVQEILPELTKTLIHPAKTDENGNEITPSKEVLGLNYTGFIALLTKGMQEQQAQILDQQKQISDQQNQLDAQKQLIDALNQKVSGATGINTINSVETGFQMSQNEPNPFTHETVVKYTLPQTVSSAFMAVYDLTGKQIITFAIDQKGASSMTLTSEKLAAGIYIYSIVADGKVMDSKRMIVSEK